VVALPASALAATARPAGPTPAPASFVANSMSWLSASRGFVLGAAKCGSKTCTEVIGTTNGGSSWTLLGKIAASIPQLGLPGSGVIDVRFSTPKVGWAYGSKLFRTTNGGTSWTATPVPGGGNQVLSLAATSTGAYAIVSPCKFGQGLSGCATKSLSLWRTKTLAGGWTKVPLTLPINVTADVAAYGSTVYVIDGSVFKLAAGSFYVSTDGGLQFKARTSPCDLSLAETLDQATPSSATDVALLCTGNPGISQSVKSVWESANAAKTDKQVGTFGLTNGIQSEVAYSPTGHLAVSSWSDGSFIFINNGKQATWTESVASADGGAGWNDITFVAGSKAWVVGSPIDMHVAYGWLLASSNAGLTWTHVKV